MEIKKNNQPEDTIRDGALSCSIWKNENENGTRYSVTFQKSYTLDEGKTWKQTQTLQQIDLLKLNVLLSKCYEKIQLFKIADNFVKGTPEKII